MIYIELFGDSLLAKMMLASVDNEPGVINTVP
jgi:hypothetical protein